MKIRDLRDGVAAGTIYSIVVAPYPAPGGNIKWVVLANGEGLLSVRNNRRYFPTVDNARKALQRLGVKQFLVRMTLAEIDDEITFTR